MVISTDPFFLGGGEKSSSDNNKGAISSGPYVLATTTILLIFNTYFFLSFILFSFSISLSFLPSIRTDTHDRFKKASIRVRLASVVVSKSTRTYVVVHST